MEFYPEKPFEEDEKPEKTGESKASKKKKSKRSKFPLPVEKREAEKSEEKTEKADKTPEIFKSKKDKPELSKEDDKEEPLELPEVQADESEQPYLGELIIDHSDESEQVQDIELPEKLIAEQPAVDPVEAEAAQPYEEQDPAASLESPEETSEPLAAIPAQEIPQYNFYPEQEAVLMPTTERMFNPNDWRAENHYQPVASAERLSVVPETEAHRREHRAEKRALSRGVTSGALAGWWLGRRNLRRQHEQQQAERYQAVQQDIERVSSQVDDLEKTIQKRESAFERAQQRLRTVIERNWDTNVFKRNESLATDKTEARTEPINPEPKRYETFKPPVETVSKPEPESPMVPIEEQEITEDIYKAPEGSRYETSAWHSIEVDEKTGRLVERPEREYGEAFHQEQQQERLAREAAQAQTAAQVAMTMGFSSASSAAPVTDSTYQPAVELPASPRRPLISPQDIQFAKQQLIQGTTNPATWAAAGLILLFLIATRII